MDWMYRLLGRQVPGPAAVMAENPIANWDNLGHLTPNQKLEYVHTEARRVVSLARQRIASNKEVSKRELDALNEKEYATIKAAEAAYEKAKGEVR